MGEVRQMKETQCTPRKESSSSRTHKIPGHSKEIEIVYDVETGRQRIPYLGIEARALSIDGRPVHQDGSMWVTVTHVDHFPNEYADGYINLITPYEDN